MVTVSLTERCQHRFACHALKRGSNQPSVEELKAAGCEKVFREKITGTTADRPQFKKLMGRLAAGDVVIIPAVDRLSRDTTDLLVIARDTQQAGAGIQSLAEPFFDTTSDFAEIIFAILGVTVKLERRRILERTARSRADAKAKGVKFGRKPTLTPYQLKEVLASRWRAAEAWEYFRFCTLGVSHKGFSAVSGTSSSNPPSSSGESRANLRRVPSWLGIFAFRPSRGRYPVEAAAIRRFLPRARPRSCGVRPWSVGHGGARRGTRASSR
jgi:hypothetical protein